MDKIFCQSEKEVIKIIGTRKITISKLADIYYKDRQPVLNQNNSISSVVRMINKKCVFHDLNWFINGDGLGRGGKTVWKDDRA